MIIHHQLTLLSPCMASRAGPAWDRNEGIADTDRKLGLGRVDSLVEKPQHPGAHYVYYIQLKREVGYLKRAESGGRVYGMSLDQGDRCS